MRSSSCFGFRNLLTELGTVHVPFAVENPWFTGAADVVTYALDELLCTKLRALYQRKKGRDVFDLWYTLEAGRLDIPVLLSCFQRYMKEGGDTVTRAQMEENLAGKRSDPDFRNDVSPLLRPGISWDFDAALDGIIERVVAHLPGAPWKGTENAKADGGNAHARDAMKGLLAKV